MRQRHRKAPIHARVSPRQAWMIVIAVTILSFVPGVVAKASPPGIPTKATAQSELDALTVESETYVVRGLHVVGS